MSDRLRQELAAASLAVRQVHLDRMQAVGVSIAWLADAPTYPFGVAPCEGIGGGLYQPGEGALHVIVPVLDGGALVDLCAFRTTAPGTWYLRTGNGWALGLERGLGWHMWYAPADPKASPPRYQVGRPVHLLASPLDWLQARGEGIAVLDWTAPEIRTLDVFGEVVCQTPTIAELLRQALTRPPRLPKIGVMEARLAA